MGKILYVLDAVRAGGSATSLLNLLSLLKENGEEADLFLLQHDGIFLDRARECTNLLPEEKIISSIRCSKEKLNQRGIAAIIIRLLFVMMRHIFGNTKTWLFFARMSAQKITGYDTVVAYQEDITTWYVQFIPAHKRIAWCHMDYDHFAKGCPVNAMNDVYSHYSDIVCVSDVVKKSILENLDFNKAKVHRIYNTIPRGYITKKAEADDIQMQKARYVFVSMGRFVQQKRFDRVIVVAKELMDHHVDFVWYILGDGEEYENIRESIKEKELEHRVMLTGVLENPFPYIAKATCFVLSSENEAQPMVLNEALTLGIPVITTDFKSSREVVADEMNGLIVSNNEDGLLTGIMRIIENPDIYMKIKRGAESFQYNNGKILEQISDIVN